MAFRGDVGLQAAFDFRPDALQDTAAGIFTHPALNFLSIAVERDIRRQGSHLKLVLERVISVETLRPRHLVIGDIIPPSCPCPD